MSIEVKSLSYQIDSKYLVKDISFKIEQNKILTVIGPNGAGKSTLIKLLSGDMPATAGTILFDGKKLASISIQERAFIRSVMSQSQEIVFDFSVKEVIEMGWLDKGNSAYFSQFDEVVDEGLSGDRSRSIIFVTQRRFRSPDLLTPQCLLCSPPPLPSSLGQTPARLL